MKRRQIIFSTIIFVFSYLIYIITAAPGLTFTDSGELAAVCSTLGVAHPTGYPLFTLLGHLWTYLPIPGSDVYSLNIFAGFLTSVSAVVFFNLVLLILNFLNTYSENSKSKSGSKKGKNIKSTQPGISISDNYIELISLMMALLYAFAGTIWAQAVAIEVYSLHLLLLNMILFFFFKATFSENSKPFYIITALLLGLGFTNHMTTLLLIPMILFFYFKLPGKKVNITNEKINFLLFLIIPFAIGLSLYLYLPLRSSTCPDLNWGYVSRGFSKFWYHFSGKQYQVWMFSGADVMKENIVKFFEVLPQQFAWIGIAGFFYGLYVTFIKSKTVFLGLIILIISAVLYSINYSIHDIESYFVTAFVGMFIVTAIGILKLLEYNKNIVFGLFVLPLVSLLLNYGVNDRSKDNLVPEYTRIVFQKLEPNAVILSAQWDFWVSAAWYLQKVEGVRPDIMIIDKELLRRTWYIEQLKKWYPERMKKCQKAIDSYLIDLELFESDQAYSPESIQMNFVNLLNCFVDANYDKYPVYFTLDVIETELDIAKDYQKIATGFAFKLTKETEPIKLRTQEIDIRKFKESLINNKGYLVDGIKSIAAINFVNMGRYALMTGDKDQARIAFEKGFQIDPQNSFVRDAINNFNKFKFE